MNDPGQRPPSSEDLALLTPPGLHPARGFSHGVVVPPGARMLYVAGQIGADEHLQLVSDGLPGQLERALRNVVAVVEHAGGTRERLVRLAIYVTDRDDYLRQLPALGRAYKAALGSHYPAMVLAGVTGLMHPAALVEVEGVAALPA